MHIVCSVAPLCVQYVLPCLDICFHAFVYWTCCYVGKAINEQTDFIVNINWAMLATILDQAYVHFTSSFVWITIRGATIESGLHLYGVRIRTISSGRDQAFSFFFETLNTEIKVVPSTFPSSFLSFLIYQVVLFTLLIIQCCEHRETCIWLVVTCNVHWNKVELNMQQWQWHSDLESDALSITPQRQMGSVIYLD